jgi:hypothetical protein
MVISNVSNLGSYTSEREGKYSYMQPASKRKVLAWGMFMRGPDAIFAAPLARSGFNARDKTQHVF